MISKYCGVDQHRNKGRVHTDQQRIILICSFYEINEFESVLLQTHGINQKYEQTIYSSKIPIITLNKFDDLKINPIKKQLMISEWCLLIHRRVVGVVVF